MFDDNFYIFVVVIAVLLMVIYGRPNKTSDYIVEYDNEQFKYLEKIYFIDKQIENNNKIPTKIINNDINGSIEDITSRINNCERFIPNIVSIYNITLNPKSFININKYTGTNKIMLIKVHNQIIPYDYIKLLVNNNYECDNNICGNYAYLYPLNKSKSIVNIYPIFNDSDKIVNLTIYIVKKPFWYL
jgi:hypothetical protein